MQETYSSAHLASRCHIIAFPYNPQQALQHTEYKFGRNLWQFQSPLTCKTFIISPSWKGLRGCAQISGSRLDLVTAAQSTTPVCFLVVKIKRLFWSLAKFSCKRGKALFLKQIGIVQFERQPVLPLLLRSRLADEMNLLALGTDMDSVFCSSCLNNSDFLFCLGKGLIEMNLSDCT